MIVLKIVIFIITLHQTLYWVYYWQIKEYRRDRFLAGLNFFNQFNLRYWYRPRPTLRVILSLIPPLIFVFSNQNLLSVILSPVITALSVGLFTPAFIFYKRYLIKKATGKFKGIVVGITGSYGKSSTKELLAHVLSVRYKVVKTPKNINSEIGVAQTVLKLKGDEEIFVVEMGAYKRGEIKSICEIVKPKVGIITGIGDQHLSLFGSLENIKLAKYELINSLPKNGLGLVADHNFYLSDAKNLKQNMDNIEFDFEGTHFIIPVIGKELARNIIAVIKVALHLGVSLPEICDQLKSFDPDLIFPKLKKIDNNIYIIDNTYNASIESFLSSLEYLKIFTGFKKILVTSGLIELGANAKKDWEIILEKASFVDKIVLAKNYKIINKPRTVYLLMGRLKYD